MYLKPLPITTNYIYKIKLFLIMKKIAVMSGKGGVGKTTIAVNLAVALGKKFKIGLLDADIDCPNINKILGINHRFKVQKDRIIPIEKFGIKVVSFASFQDDETKPIIWRGPLLTKALMQLNVQVDWQDIDYLIIDLPPGTSDLPLTVMQMLKPDGMIIVTTPQNIALTDAKRSINMAFDLGVPVIGIIENMSGDVFGSGKAEKVANEFNVKFLGSLELRREIAESAEKQEPFIISNDFGFDKIIQNIK